MPWSDWSDTLHTSSHSSLFSYFTPVSYRQWYKQLVSVSFIKSLIKYTLTFQNLPSSTFSTSFSSSPLVWLDLDCEAVSGSPAHSPSFPSPPDFIEICPYAEVIWRQRCSKLSPGFIKSGNVFKYTVCCRIVRDHLLLEMELTARFFL